MRLRAAARRGVEELPVEPFVTEEERGRSFAHDGEFLRRYLFERVAEEVRVVHAYRHDDAERDVRQDVRRVEPSAHSRLEYCGVGLPAREYHNRGGRYKFKICRMVVLEVVRPADYIFELGGGVEPLPRRRAFAVYHEPLREVYEMRARI